MVLSHRAGSQVTSRGRACQGKLAADGFPSLVARSRLLLLVIASNRCCQRYSVYARSVRLATCGLAAEAAPKGCALAHPRSQPVQAPRNPSTHLGADSSLEAAKAAKGGPQAALSRGFSRQAPARLPPHVPSAMRLRQHTLRLRRRGRRTCHRLRGRPPAQPAG